MQKCRNFKWIFLLLTVFILSACGGGGGGGSDSASSDTTETGSTVITEIGTISISSETDTLVADGQQTTDITVTLTDSTNNPIEASTVNFSTTSGTFSNTATTTSAVTDAFGQAIVTLVAPTSVGQAEVRASINTERSDPIQIECISSQIGGIEVSSALSTIEADGLTTTALTATLININDEAMMNQTITFSSDLGILYNTTAETNSEGQATVILKASGTPGLATIIAEINGFAAQTQITYNDSAAIGSFEIGSDSASVLADGLSSISITATIKNTLTAELPGRTINFSSNFGTLNSPTAVTNSLGTATVWLTAPATAGVATIKAEIDDLVAQTTINFTVDSTIGAIQINSDENTVIADNVTDTPITVTLTNTYGAPMVDYTVNFSTNLGTFNTTTVKTNILGEANARLKAPSSTGLATIIADVDGISARTKIDFIAGDVSVSNSTITATPSQLKADGESYAEINVVLQDSFNNLLAEGTPVTLLADAGSVYINNSDLYLPNNTGSIISGRATFYLLAPVTASTPTITISVADYPELSAEITLGSTSNGEPASVLIENDVQHVFVSGVGQVDNTFFTITVVDSAGAAISESQFNDPDQNNVKISFTTAPGGGEFATGTDDTGEIINTLATDAMEIKTVNGVATVGFQAGNRPGPVELKVEVLLDASGNLLPTPIVASFPLLTVSSGPPHTINLTTPNLDAIENLGGGVYRRIGTAMVTDRYGNAVPDGTVINLGLLDSVVAAGTVNVSDETVAPVGLSLDSTITRNEVERGIEEGDRILIHEVEAADKARTVEIINVDDLETQAAYSQDYLNKQAVIGASLLGGQIAGTDADGNITPGLSVVTTGLADITVTYPANSNTIHVGVNPSIDARHLPLNSARVYTLAWASDSGATTINEGLFNFSSIADWSLSTVIPTVINASTDDNQRFEIPLVLIDSDIFGDGIRLPYIKVSTSISTELATGSDLTVTVTDSNTINIDTPYEDRTNRSGEYTAVITLSGSTIQANDKVTVVFSAGDASVTIYIFL